MSITMPIPQPAQPLRGRSALAPVVLLGLIAACSSSAVEVGSAGGAPGTGTGGNPGAFGTGGSTGSGGATGTGGESYGTGGGPQVCTPTGSHQGTSGSGGSEGIGGRGGICCVAPTNCIQGLCGNGVRDTCSASSGPDPCPAVSFSEGCDGADLGGVTCQGSGYGYGEVACSSMCQLNYYGCYTCAAGSPPVTQCNSVATQAVSAPSLAATDDETAVVWVEPTFEIGFMLLSSRLEVLVTGHIAAPPPAGTARYGDAQVAALPSGWVVLLRVDSTLTLFTLDRTGNVVATNALDPMTGGFDLSLAFLVSRPGGGPMVAWGSIDNYAAVVSADGLHVTTPVRLPYDLENVGPTLPSLMDATYAAGQFQAVLAANCDLGPNCVEIVSISSDGTIAGTFQAPGVSATWGMLLESGTDDLQLFYGADCGATLSDAGCLMWERMTPTGTALASQLVFQPINGQLLPQSAVAIGADNYLSFSPGNVSSTLVHSGADGTLIGDPRPFAMNGTASATIVRQGSNLVAAWVASYTERIEVALLAP